VLRFTFGRSPADKLEVSTMAPAASMKNFSDLLAQVPSGAWVAISQDGLRVVAFGPEMRDVIEKAREAGENDPIITRVPQSNMALIL
jgi:hypothetical protein